MDEDLHGGLTILRDPIDKQDQVRSRSSRSDPAYAASHEMDRDLLIMWKTYGEFVTKEVDKRIIQLDHPELHRPLSSRHCPVDMRSKRQNLRGFSVFCSRSDVGRHLRDDNFQMEQQMATQTILAAVYMKDSHRSQNRFFNDQQEAKIAAESVSRYIGQQSLVTLAPCRVVAGERRTELGSDPNEFKCSDKFI
jgi:hypothetical protein